MPMREELRARLLQTFREEAAEHVAVLERELASIRKEQGGADSRQRVEVLFRTMHTLKGAARSVQLTEIEKICHESELKLRDAVNGAAPPSRSLFESLEKSLDDLQHAMDRMQRLSIPAQNSAPTAEPPQAFRPSGAAPAAERQAPTKSVRPMAGVDPSRPATNAGGRVAAGETGMTHTPPADVVGRSLATIRVDIGKLDRLMLAAEDLLMPSLAVTERKRAVRRIQDEISGLRTLVRSKLHNSDKAMDGEVQKTRGEVLNVLRDIEIECRRVTGALAEDERVLRTTVGDLYQEMRQVRVLPVNTMFAAFPSMVRDLCRQAGKRAGWHFTDRGFEIDRKVMDAVKDALIHLVRNAVDHGIEAPAERAAVGKAEEGRVTVSVNPGDAGRILIEISDDGRGLDTTALREAAVRSRILSRAQAAELSEAEVLDLSFRSGVSTSPVVTSISGLGLGLSIAREQAERIGGQITVRTERNIGTTISLDLPTTIASYRGILVKVGDSKFLVPSDAVERVIGIPERQAESALQAALLAHGNVSVPFARLASAMGMPTSITPTERHLAPCVMIRSGQRLAALMVDDLLGEAEVLVKEFPAPLKRVQNIANVGLLPTGDLALIVRPSDIVAAVYAGTTNVRPDAVASGARQLRLLVVDDSITTRTMERNLFENAGYSVVVATDGADAWSLLQSEPVDLVVSDVDMPRMNGFELTESIRKDPRLADLPIVLVTALETRDDKERGVRSGANAYVLKSSFDQSNLLEIVGRLI